MHNTNYTFLVGAPGSRWSGVGQIIADTYGYNQKDETEWRIYTHGDFSGHRGAYWGPGMELGQNFHRLELEYGSDVERFLKDCDKAWDVNGSGTKLVKCHQFAYSLHWIYNNVPNSNILLVKRGNNECFDWWKQAGGWDITYPNYSWYVDDPHMKHYIELENKMADAFVSEFSNWYPFTSEWLYDNFGNHNVAIDNKKYGDVSVCLVNTVCT